MNQITFSILRLLSNGKFRSGVSIAKQFQCSRAKISKTLKHIDVFGIDLTKLCARKNYDVIRLRSMRSRTN